MGTNKPHCCYITPTGVMCGNPAEWEVYHGQHEADYTHACTEHVGALLTDAPEHRVYPIEKSE
jgi:hypothetical protein